MRLAAVFSLSVLTFASACGDDARDRDDRRIDDGDLYEIRGGDHDASWCEDEGDLDLPAPSPTCSTAGATSWLALGVCGELRADNTLTVRSTNNNALVAANGYTTTSSPLNIEGSLISFGSIDARNTQNIEGDLSTAGDWTISSPVNARSDAYVAGRIDARNTLNIEGTLHVNDPSDAGNANAALMSVGPVEVARPLDCSRVPRARVLADALLDDGERWAAVHFGRERNSRVTEPTELTLGCGRYAFDSLEVNNTLRIRITGDVVIVIDGRLRIASPTVFELDPDATLMMVIRDSLEIDNNFRSPTAATPTTPGSPSAATCAWLRRSA